MPEYIIVIDAGYGASYEVVDADNEDDAHDQSYEMWKEEAVSNAEYGVIGLATEELREEYGV